MPRRARVGDTVLEYLHVNTHEYVRVCFARGPIHYCNTMVVQSLGHHHARKKSVVQHR